MLITNLPEVGRRDGSGVTPVPGAAKLQVCPSLMRKSDVDKP